MECDTGSILVTGGAGFIGSHLCERLVELGERVVCYDNLDPYYDPAIKRQNIAALVGHLRFHFVQADILDLPSLTATLEQYGVSRIVHLAALAGVRPSLRDPVKYQWVNIGGTTSVLEAARQHEIQSIVMASSSSVYGQSDRIPFCEDDLALEPISPYASSKLGAETIASVYGRLHNMDIFCLRFFTVYGPRQRPDMAISRFVRRILDGRPIEIYGDGSASRDFTYVDDIVAGIISALDCRQARGFQIINFGSSRPVDLKKLVGLIGEACGRKPIVQNMPEQDGDVERTWASIEKAKALLGYSPSTQLIDGLHSYVSWLTSGRAFERSPISASTVAEAAYVPIHPV